MNNLLSKETIMYYNNDKPITSKELFQIVSKKLESLGYVKGCYGKAIEKRETEFPTGLEASPFNIAIPHTEASNVLKSCIYIVRTKEPVLFHNMVDVSGVINVNIIFFIVLSDADKQICVLQDIVNLVKDEDKMTEIMQANSNEEIYNILNNIDFAQ